MLVVLSSVGCLHSSAPAWQGMVERSELMAAISEANANRDEAALKEQDLQWHRDQLSKLREQLLEAQRELGRIHILMGSMVQKSVVDEMQAAADLQQEAAMSLRESLRSLQNEKAALELLMQVSVYFFCFCDDVFCR